MVEDSSHAGQRPTFDLHYDEMQSRYKLLMYTFEEGKLTLSEYFDKVIFYKERPFTPKKFQLFMFAQSSPDEAMIQLILNSMKRII